MTQQISPSQFSATMAEWLRSGLDEVKKADGRTQEDLANALGINRSNVSKMANGKQDIPPHYYATIAAFIGKQPPYFSVPEVDATPAARPAPNASFPPQYQRLGSDKAVPLYGQTVGGANGKFVLNGQTIDYLFRPPNLLNVDEAYAVRIYGTSMEPRYKAGETIWINPIEPVRAGDDVVVQIVDGDDEHPESYIKEFVSQSSKVLRLKQLNPDEGEDEILEFPADKVFSVHKVVFHAKA